MSKCIVCGKNLGIFAFKKKCTNCIASERHDKPSAEEIQRILNKPWSEVTKEDRKSLCTQELGVNISGGHGNSKVEHLDQFPKKREAEVQQEMIQIIKIWVIPPEGCPIEAHKLLDGQTVDAQDTFEIPSGEYQGIKADGPGLFGLRELDDNCQCWLDSGIKKR